MTPFFGEVGIDPFTKPGFLMTPFQTFADEDLASLPYGSLIRLRRMAMPWLDR